jgi:hypothetical protein
MNTPNFVTRCRSPHNSCNFGRLSASDSLICAKRQEMDCLLRSSVQNGAMLESREGCFVPVLLCDKAQVKGLSNQTSCFVVEEPGLVHRARAL